MNLKARKPTSNETTNAILKYLNALGIKAWRNNQIAAPGRKFVGLRGVSDIIGHNFKYPYLSKGVFVAVEVKYGYDKPTPEQKAFLKDVEDSGGVAIVAKSFDSFLEQFAKKYQPQTQRVTTSLKK